MDTDLQPECINPNPESRKRGAQKGNINALKHGFYSERFRNVELEDLLNIPAGSLEDEIAIIRVITRRAANQAEEGGTPAELLEIYNLIGEMCMRISAMLRTQKMLSAGGSDLDALYEAIDSVRPLLAAEWMPVEGGNND